jgi:hypothetical protein
METNFNYPLYKFLRKFGFTWEFEIADRQLKILDRSSYNLQTEICNLKSVNCNLYSVISPHGKRKEKLGSANSIGMRMGQFIYFDEKRDVYSK